MKKLFFTALVAVVAIGGAFAGNASKPTTTIAGLPGGPCDISIACSPNNNPPCQLNPLDPTTQVYEKNSIGNCTIYLGFD